MIRTPATLGGAPVILIGIGNSATHIATWHKDAIKTPVSVPTGDQAALAEGFAAHAGAVPQSKPVAAVIGSVVPDALAMAATHVGAVMDRNALVVGADLPLPMDVSVDDPTKVGVDRVCAAAAAYEKLQTSCVVVDFGTAVTVDLVNDEGVFVGGAILPGLQLQLRALREHTAQLPDVPPGFPKLSYGRNTTEAIQNGVCRGLVGAVRGLIEGYATSLNHWPQVLATGGDLVFLMPHCDFLDTPVEHLALRGIGLAYSKYLREKGV